MTQNIIRNNDKLILDINMYIVCIIFYYNCMIINIFKPLEI